MLIDRLLPEFEFRERHETAVRARSDSVYSAVKQVDFASNRIVGFLLGLRALPARLMGYRNADSFSRPLTLRDAEQFGFFIAAENPPVELVIALQGKFWALRGGTECASREALNAQLPPGIARAAWNFSIRPTGPSSCVLATETRVHCADSAARRRFRIYWMFVRPGSGIIRRLMLRTVRDIAERSA